MRSESYRIFWLRPEAALCVRLVLGSLLCQLFLQAPPAVGAANEAADWAAAIEAGYRVERDLMYQTTAQVRLDVVWRPGRSGPQPTVLYIHGGGWVGGSKEDAVLQLLPFLAKGFQAVNVEYRLGTAAPAPAAVEDVRCSLYWVDRNADRFLIDRSRVVVAGHSVGGHLSLLAAMLDPEAGFDGACGPGAPVRVAAVVNFFGVTDVADVLDGPNPRDWAARWFGSQPHEPLASRLSPVTLAKPGLPPVVTVHGDTDPVVPFRHAAELQERLRRAGVGNRLIRLSGGGHGGFGPSTGIRVYRQVFEFLSAHGVRPASPDKPLK